MTIGGKRDYPPEVMSSNVGCVKRTEIINGAFRDAPYKLGPIKLAETFECADCRDMASAPTEAFVISPHFHICNCILLRVY